jgi:hypothetical protein
VLKQKGDGARKRVIAEYDADKVAEAFAWILIDILKKEQGLDATIRPLPKPHPTPAEVREYGKIYREKMKTITPYKENYFWNIVEKCYLVKRYLLRRIGIDFEKI